MAMFFLLWNFGKEMCMDDFRVIDNYLMVKMPEEIDHHRSTFISKTADDFILREKIGNIVFDFEDTRFMDSSGIGIIMGRYKKIAYFGGKVYTINTDSRIRRTLMISGLHKIVEMME
jgi:stage II sporulation protein AA (anti-sigma F factor antagonist)